MGCPVVRRRGAIPLRPKLAYYSDRADDALSLSFKEGEWYFFAEVLEVSDCPFPANVGSSHNMSYDRESRKRDRVPFDK